MLVERWTYSNQHGLTKWYGHVDYFDQYVIGQWFVLEADTGIELWSRRFLRPNAVFGCAHEVIVASETRSDGPWTCDFGIYGIDAQTGKLRWTNHGRGLWGKALRCLDYIPGFTNEFRDAPEYVADRYVVTSRKRLLDIRTGHEHSSVDVLPSSSDDPSRPERLLYNDKSLVLDGDTITVEGHGDEFLIYRCDHAGRVVWRFSAKERSMHVDGSYFSYRLHKGSIYMVVGDGPNLVPIKADAPLHCKPNPVNYQACVLDIASGEWSLYPLKDASQRKQCRIETIRGSRILVSCDGTELVEYEIAA